MKRPLMQHPRPRARKKDKKSSRRRRNVHTPQMPTPASQESHGRLSLLSPSHNHLQTNPSLYTPTHYLPCFLFSFLSLFCSFLYFFFFILSFLCLLTLMASMLLRLTCSCWARDSS